MNEKYINVCHLLQVFVAHEHKHRLDGEESPHGSTHHIHDLIIGIFEKKKTLCEIKGHKYPLWTLKNTHKRRLLYIGHSWLGYCADLGETLRSCSSGMYYFSIESDRAVPKFDCCKGWLKAIVKWTIMMFGFGGWRQLCGNSEWCSYHQVLTHGLLVTQWGISYQVWLW